MSKLKETVHSAKFIFICCAKSVLTEGENCKWLPEAQNTEPCKAGGGSIYKLQLTAKNIMYFAAG